MTTKITVERNLLGKEDLHLGTGSVVQNRNGVEVTITAIDYESRIASAENKVATFDANIALLLDTTATADNNAAAIASNLSKINTNTASISTNKTDLTSLTATVNTTTAALAENTSDIEVNAGAILNLSVGIGILNTRAAAIENNLATNSSNLSSFENSLAALVTRVTSTENSVSANETTIANNNTSLQTDINSVKTRVTKNETDIANFSTSPAVTINTSPVGTSTADALPISQNLTIAIVDSPGNVYLPTEAPSGSTYYIINQTTNTFRVYTTSNSYRTQSPNKSVFYTSAGPNASYYNGAAHGTQRRANSRGTLVINTTLVIQTEMTLGWQGNPGTHYKLIRNGQLWANFTTGIEAAFYRGESLRVEVISGYDPSSTGVYSYIY